MEFDEDDAIAYIKEYLKSYNLGADIDDDTILEIIDLSFDFYDDLDDDDDFEINIAENGRIEDDANLDQLVSYIAKGMRKSKPDLKSELIKAITCAELLYENTLD